MALIRDRASLVLAAVKKDNPAVTIDLTPYNCYVYRLGSFSKTKGFCTVKGIFGHGVRDKRIFKYNKYDLPTLLKNVSHVIDYTGATLVSHLLAKINERYGLDLTLTDIVDKTLTEGGTKAELEISVGSVLYTGKVELTVVPGKPDLASVVVNRELQPAFAIWPISTGFNGSKLTVGHDYTYIASPLSSYATGVLTPEQATELAAYLKQVDGVPWTGVGSQTYSLKGANVLFNDVVENITSDLKPLLRKQFNRALILSVSTVENSNMAAVPVAIHYNVF